MTLTPLISIEVSIRRVAVSDGRWTSRYADARRRCQPLKRVVQVGLAARRRAADLARLRRQVAEAVIAVVEAIPRRQR